MDRSQLLLAVDVGNSKTHVAVTDRTGRLVGAAAGPGLNGMPMDPVLQLDELLDLIDRAIGFHTGFSASTFAMAGLDLPFEEERMARLVGAAQVSALTNVCNDTFALLRTGSASGDGIAVVAGAGINCVGVHGDRTVRFHSLGRVSGDWGGGQDVGEEGLAAACRAEDGRGAPTLLSRRIPQHFGLERALQVTEAVQLLHMSQGRLVELAPIVFGAALDGDEASIAIVHRLADEVALFINAVCKRMGAEWECSTILLGGGLLQSKNTVLIDRIESAPTLTGKRLTFATVPPILGAILLAFDQLPEKNPEIEHLSFQWSHKGAFGREH